MPALPKIFIKIPGSATESRKRVYEASISADQEDQSGPTTVDSSVAVTRESSHDKDERSHKRQKTGRVNTGPELDLDIFLPNVEPAVARASVSTKRKRDTSLLSERGPRPPKRIKIARPFAIPVRRSQRRKPVIKEEYPSPVSARNLDHRLVSEKKACMTELLQVDPLALGPKLAIIPTSTLFSVGQVVPLALCPKSDQEQILEAAEILMSLRGAS